MSEYSDALRKIVQPSFGFTDEERRKIIDNYNAGTRSQFSAAAENSNQPFRPGDIFERVTQSLHNLERSVANLNDQNAALNVFMFHCLNFIMGELAANPGQALKAKRAIKQNINQSFPEDSAMKSAAFNFCENFFAGHSTGENQAIEVFTEQ